MGFDNDQVFAARGHELLTPFEIIMAVYPVVVGQCRMAIPNHVNDHSTTHLDF